ncbi:uncharacterized protein [Henckelia pumila]|uniref:uncharacterized protein n=1 Tax=Henckelia pumila TaxID=405737 RepID=UPI003C6E33CB
MISGGPTDGDSNRARKMNSRKLVNMEIGNQIVHNDPTLSFGPKDLKGISNNHNDALVIRAMVANYDVARIFVDSGSSVTVLFQEAINQMDLGQYKIEPVITSLFGFTGHAIRPVGLVHLPLTLGKSNIRKTRIVSFIIVDASSAYNVILGRPAMTTFMAVASALHQKIKFPVGNEVGEVQGDQIIARKCYVEEVRIEQKVARTDNIDRPGLSGMEKVNLIEDTSVTTEEEIEEILISPPSGVVKIARTLETRLKQLLLECLEKNKDVFAWSVSDLVRVHREVAEHQLNVIKGCRPIIQKKRHFGPEKDAVIKEQVDELLRAGHIEEIYFPTWLSNIVLVPKSSGKWRMCVDFRDLNKACPKDCYLLPRIDQLVDSTAGHELLSFLDAYQGYHQIPLAKQDKDKVSFVTSTGTYCYMVMPFGLKKCWGYIPKTLKRYQLKLNPSKCTFGVRSGKFLGYMVTRRGIKANPEKVQAIIFMSSPKNIQEVQRLTGRITALARFISSSADKSLLFFKALRKTKHFEWNEESENLIRIEVLTELIPRAENIKADHLARLASALSDRSDPIVAGRELVSQLETLDDIIAQVPEGDWRYDMHKYLIKKELPSDNKKAKEVKRRALRFVMIDQILFKRSFSQPLLKCLGPDEANYVLREIQEGSCGSHLGSLALAQKALLAGFFWPTMRKDSADLVNSCYNCQRHANLQWRPAEYMKAVVAACLFYQWGMNLVGSFPVSTGQKKFLLVAVDYFSK